MLQLLPQKIMKAHLYLILRIETEGLVVRAPLGTLSKIKKRRLI
jgi:hypothetical protein